MKSTSNADCEHPKMETNLTCLPHHEGFLPRCIECRAV